MLGSTAALIRITIKMCEQCYVNVTFAESMAIKDFSICSGPIKLTINTTPQTYTSNETLPNTFSSE